MDDAERELAGRRRDLEREFDAKMRDLKSQTKRLAESLEQDRREWEERRRVQQKELADREEKVRRREDNREKAAEAKADDRAAVEALRLRVRELEERNLDARTAIARLEERGARLYKTQAAAQNLLTVAVALGAMYGVVWMTIALRDGHRASQVLAGVFLAATAMVAALRWRIRRPPPTRT